MGGNAVGHVLVLHAGSADAAASYSLPFFCYTYHLPYSSHSSRISYGLDFRWQFQFQFDCN